MTDLNWNAPVTRSARTNLMIAIDQFNTNEIIRLVRAYPPILFENMRGDTRKKVYAIDYHYGKKAMLQASMPTWWSNKVSKAYSSVSV